MNPVQTEILYTKAIEYAGLTGKERIVDAYCGIGTIGLIAASKAKEVISVELNRDAVRDAVTNAKRNDIKNVQFYNADAGQFMVEMAEYRADQKKIRCRMPQNREKRQHRMAMWMSYSWTRQEQEVTRRFYLRSSGLLRSA